MTRRAGFTLIEVLVGLAVASIALTAGFGALAFVRDRADQAEASTATALAGAAMRGLLIDWLTGARLNASNGGGSFQGQDGDAQNLPNDELVFPTTARTPLMARNTVVRLYVDEDDETPETGLVAELTERQQDEPRRVELLPNVTGLQIRYLPDSQDGTADWMDGWVGRNELPRAVEITLAVAPGDSLPALLRLPVRVALGTLR